MRASNRMIAKPSSHGLLAFVTKSANHHNSDRCPVCTQARTMQSRLSCFYLVDQLSARIATPNVLFNHRE